MNFAANPIFARMSGLKVWPTRAFALRSAGLVIGSAVLAGAGAAAIFAISNMSDVALRNVNVTVLPALLTGGFGLISGLLMHVTAFAAARVSAKDAAADAFQLTLLTPLPTRQFVWGYLGVATYKLRWVFTIQVALMVIVLIFQWLSWFAFGDVLEQDVPEPLRIIAFLLSIPEYVVTLWLSAILGVWLGLSIRDTTGAPVAAAVASFVGNLAIFSASAAVAALVSFDTVGRSLDPTSAEVWSLIIGLNVLIVLFRLAISRLLFWLAERQINLRRPVMPR